MLKPNRAVPKRKFVRKYPTRRNFKRKANQLTGIGLPKALKSKLQYSETILLPTGVSGYADYIFTPTNLYDINNTGGGAQPTFFDQICNGTLYNRYQVYGVSYRITFVSSDSAPMEVATLVTGDSALPGNGITDTYGQVGVKRRVLTFATGSSPMKTITGYFNVTKALGQRYNAASDNEYGAAYNTTSGPATKPYLHVAMQTADGGSIVGYMYVTFTLYCKFSQLQIVAQS